MFIINIQQKNKVKNQTGFAIIYTVLACTLILSMAISITEVAYKENLLAGTSVQSSYADYAANVGIECALYNDRKATVTQPTGDTSIFPSAEDIAPANSPIYPSSGVDCIGDGSVSKDYPVNSPITMMQPGTPPIYTFWIDPSTVAGGNYGFGAEKNTLISPQPSCAFVIVDKTDLPAVGSGTATPNVHIISRGYNVNCDTVRAQNNNPGVVNPHIVERREEVEYGSNWNPIPIGGGGSGGTGGGGGGGGGNPPNNTGNVSVFAFDSCSGGTPIQGATEVLSGAAQTTDAYGNAVFDSVASGAATLSTRKSGYTITPPLITPMSVTVPTDGDTSEVDIYLTPVGGCSTPTVDIWAAPIISGTANLMQKTMTYLSLTNSSDSYDYQVGWDIPAGVTSCKVSTLNQSVSTTGTHNVIKPLSDQYTYTLTSCVDTAGDSIPSNTVTVSVPGSGTSCLGSVGLSNPATYTIGDSYSSTFTPQNTDSQFPGPYTYTLSKTLPPGLTRTNNVVSGTFTTLGSYDFTITAHSSVTCNTEGQEYTGTVSDGSTGIGSSGGNSPGN